MKSSCSIEKRIWKSTALETDEIQVFPYYETSISYIAALAENTLALPFHYFNRC